MVFARMVFVEEGPERGEGDGEVRVGEVGERGEPGEAESLDEMEEKGGDEEGDEECIHRGVV